MIKRVLVPLDGSKPAEKALNFALELADKYSANVVLLSVVPPVIVPGVPDLTTGVPPFPTVAMSTHSKELKASHEKVLSEALKKAKKIKPNLKLSTKLVEGRPSER
ncbi:universal stress protein [Candidatus Bathyarchaeota archaeon]|nr:universal stress protein [Candidatus Bathyarchaeota archaeon]